VLVIGAVVIRQTRWFNDVLTGIYEFGVPDCERKILYAWNDKDVDFLLRKITSPNSLHRYAADELLSRKRPVVPAMIEKYKTMTTSWYEEDRFVGYASLVAGHVYIDTEPVYRYLKKGRKAFYYSTALAILSMAGDKRACDVLLTMSESDPLNTSPLLTNATYWRDVPAYRAKIERIAKDNPDRWRRDAARKFYKKVWGDTPAPAAQGLIRDPLAGALACFDVALKKREAFFVCGIRIDVLIR